MTPQEIAHRIDHTLLKPDATEADIRQLCAEAREHGFFAVCVNSLFVPLCVRELTGSAVKIAAVVGFPLGAMDTATKAFEAATAVAAGAREVDMVIPIGLLKAAAFDRVQNDIAQVVRSARGAKVKVIIETALLSETEKIRACEIARSAGAAFVKTCTGFSGGNATVDDVKLMKDAVKGACEVKASGGIRDLASAKALLAAGATRLGTSSGVKLMQGLATGSGY